MNWTCPRILYFLDFGPRAERNPPFFHPFFFTSHMTCWHPRTGRLFPSNSSPALPGLPILLACAAFNSLPSDKGAPWPSNLAVIIKLTSIFLLILSPILLFILSVMNDHASRHLVTTALYCVGAPSVAVLCECGCDCAWVVQLDRKKKRVGACVGKRKVKGRKSST